MRAKGAVHPFEEQQSPEESRGPIDLEHLSRQTLGDSGLELEVLRLFDEMSRAYYTRIEKSTTAEDLLTHLHTLKGAAAGIGAFGLADLARAAEVDLRAGEPVNSERIDDLNVAVEEISAFIAQRVRAAAA